FCKNPTFGFIAIFILYRRENSTKTSVAGSKDGHPSQLLLLSSKRNEHHHSNVSERNKRILMKNKTVIRRPNQAGEFTTVHHSILHDTRLSALEFRILLSILSDADTFNLSQQLIINRLKIDKKTVQNAFKALESYGYIKRTQLKRGHYYTISEFGNLSKEEIELPSIEVQLPAIEDDKIILEDYFELLVKLIPADAPSEQITAVVDYFSDAIADGRLSKKEQMSESNIKKIITKFISIDKGTGKLPKDTIALIKLMCEDKAGGKGISIANKQKITDEVIAFFSLKLPKLPTEREISSRILSVKTKYNSTGHLDQRFQN
ncbi:MAG: hypothetical protein DI539_27040, partial [Flavobacterium psychrophilum]